MARDEKRRRHYRWGAILTLAGAVVAAIAGWLVAPDHGARLKIEGAHEERVATLHPRTAVKTATAEKHAHHSRTIELEASLDVRRPGRYLFWVDGDGPRKLVVDGREVLSIDGESAEPSIPVALDAGLHVLRAKGVVTAGKTGFGVSWRKEIKVPQAIPTHLIYPPRTPAWRLDVSRWILRLALVLALAALWSLAGWLMPARRFRRLAFALTALALALALALLLAEGALRLAGVAPRQYLSGDPWREFNFAPGATSHYSGWLPYNVKEFDVEVTLNSTGWRGADFPKDKPAGVYRIVVLGDSYVEAKEVPLERTFHKELERRLNAMNPKPAGITRFEVIALGHGGTGTVMQELWLEKVALPLKPDLAVLMYFSGNDIMDNCPEILDRYHEWSRQVYLRLITAAKIDFLDRWIVVDGSWLNHFVADRALDFYISNFALFHRGLKPGLLQSPDTEVYRKGPMEGLWLKGWQATEASVKKMQTAAAAAGVRFAVSIAFSPQAGGIDAESLESNRNAQWDLEKPSRLMAECCKALKIPALDLRPALEGFYKQTGRRYYWQHDAHWNEDGHQVVAGALESFLRPMIAAPASVSPTTATLSAPNTK